MMNYWLELVEAEEAYKRLTEDNTAKNRGIRLTTTSGHTIEMKDTLADSYIDDIPTWEKASEAFDFTAGIPDFPTEIGGKVEIPTEIKFPPIVFPCIDLTQDHM